tara:strand:- start:22 stop:381 length:360 start_codon:yes stop_codon:yes gene_type:complete
LLRLQSCCAAPRRFSNLLRNYTNQPARHRRQKYRQQGAQDGASGLSNFSFSHVTSVELMNLASLLLLLLSELAAAPATEPAFAAASGGDASLSLLVVARMAVVFVQLQAAARCQQRRRR